MRKKERVYREILYQALEKEERKLTQKNLSNRCEVAIGTVNYALSPLEDMNAIEKRQRSFLAIDPKKILLYWASHRKIKRDIVYSTYFDGTVREIEQQLPNCLLTSYSGHKFRFGEPPAGYSEVWVYGEEQEIRDRFPQKKGNGNLFVLESDKHLEKFSEVPLGQLYVDLWNMDTWYASEYIKKLDEKLKKVVEY